MQNFTSEFLFGTSKAMYSFRAVLSNRLLTTDPNATLSIYNTSGEIVLDSQDLSFSTSTGVLSCIVDISDTDKFPASTIPNWRYNCKITMEPVTDLIYEKNHWLAIVYEPWTPNVIEDDIKVMCTSMDLDSSSDDNYLDHIQRAEDELRVLFQNQNIPIGMFKQKPFLDEYVKNSAVEGVWLSRSQGEGSQTHETYLVWLKKKQAVEQSILESLKIQLTDTDDANDLYTDNWSMGTLEP